MVVPKAFASDVVRLRSKVSNKARGERSACRPVVVRLASVSVFHSDTRNSGESRYQIVKSGFYPVSEAKNNPGSFVSDGCMYRSINFQVTFCGCL